MSSSLPRALTLALCLVAAAAACHPASAQDGARLAQEAARHQGQGNLEQALKLLTEALADTRLTNDARAVIHTDRGALFARLNQPKPAIEDFNRAVQLYPEYPAIYNNRGSTLMTLGLAREAIKDFDRAIVLAPGYVAAFHNRASAKLLVAQNESAINDFSRAVDLSPGTPAPLAGRGKALLAANRPNAAIRDLSHALLSDNRFALGYRIRAEARLAVERPTEAIEDLSRAIAFEPGNIDLYIERGHAYMQADNTAAALKDYAKALELDPQSVPALEARAVAHVRLEAQNEAEADIARALELSPRANLAIAARALIYMRTGQGELARREIERALKAGPARPEVMLIKGQIDEASGRRDDAVQSYRAALLGRTLSRDATAGLARMAGDRGDTIELRGLGIDSWRVVRRGQRLFAISDEHPRISVPIEPIGDTQPRLVEFEVMRPPNRDIAVLRFSPGQAPVGDPVQHAAALDLGQGQVLGVYPDKVGAKQASLSFEDNKLVIAAADGLKDEYTLRSGGRGQSVASAGHGPQRRFSEHRTYAPPNWLPGAGPPPQRRPQRQQPKTLFDLLFGN